MRKQITDLKKYKRFWRSVRISLAILLILGTLVAAMALCISAAVVSYSAPRILTSRELQTMGTKVDCIVVLGCKVHDDGRLSNRLRDRVNTGVEVWNTGISEILLMSGDARFEDYNEVVPMRDFAIAQGVPAEAVMIDPYGLSTYESLFRMLEQYQGKRIVIVTQEYHLYRALYIADKLGYDAYGVAAPLSNDPKQLWYEGREILARWKDVVYALQQPLPTVPSGTEPME
ncbi:MAG: YdcF family protein [Clostridia bacterium]|nr:YdcF family protein [Clostridia bacterium]